jgi:hypothetical protein
LTNGISNRSWGDARQANIVQGILGMGNTCRKQEYYGKEFFHLFLLIPENGNLARRLMLSFSIH